MTISFLDSDSASATASRPASVSIALGPFTDDFVCVFFKVAGRTSTQTGWDFETPTWNGVKMLKAGSTVGALDGGGEGRVALYYLPLGDVTSHSASAVVTATTSQSEIAIEATVSVYANIEQFGTLRDIVDSLSTTDVTVTTNTVTTVSSDLVLGCMCFAETSASGALADDSQTKLTGISTTTSTDMAHVAGWVLATGTTTDDGWDTFTSAVAHITASFKENTCGTVLNFITDTWVNVPDLALTGDFTIEAWINLDPTITGDDALCGVTVSGSDINFSSVKIRLFSGSSDVITSNTTLTANTWTHVAITRSGTTLTAYKDGQPDGTGTWNGTFDFEGLGTGNRGIGFGGSMDEFRVWDITRTDDEMEHYHDRSVDPHTPGLLGYWKFNDPIGSQIVTDSSLAGNDGTLGLNSTPDTDDPVQVQNSSPAAFDETCGDPDEDPGIVVHKH